MYFLLFVFWNILSGIIIEKNKISIIFFTIKKTLFLLFYFIKEIKKTIFFYLLLRFLAEFKYINLYKPIIYILFSL